MATPFLADDATSDLNQYLTFTLGKEMYAIPLLGVKEIIEYGLVTSIPTMPEFVRGVINLRGRVVPVVDLSSRFGYDRVQVGKRTCIIIVEVQNENARQDIGIVVDSVNAVTSIEQDDIEPRPNFGAKIRIDFIHGMWKLEDQFVIILELEKVLSLDEIIELSKITQSEGNEKSTSSGKSQAEEGTLGEEGAQR